MGVYNTVCFTCPRCDNNIEAQSKAVDGHGWFHSRQVDINTANDIEGNYLACEHCKTEYQVRLEVPVQMVTCYLVKV